MRRPSSTWKSQQAVVDELRTLVPAPPGPPRIPPATREEMGRLNWVLCSLVSRGAGASGGGRNSTGLHVFTTLARRRRLFRAWLRLGAAVLLFGSLPRAETELVILRVAYQCRSSYEWYQHVPIALRVGVAAQDIRAVATPAGVQPDASSRTRAFVAALDELAATNGLSDSTWNTLRRHLGQEQTIGFLQLRGYYYSLAATLNAIGVRTEA